VKIWYPSRYLSLAREVGWGFFASPTMAFLCAARLYLIEVDNNCYL